MKQPSNTEVEVIDGDKATSVSKPEKKPKKYKKPKKLKPKHIITLVIVLALVAAAVILLYKLFFGAEDQEVQTDLTTYGALNATITGTGTTTPGDSETYNLAADAEILEVDVAQGDTVTAGQLLYIQDSSDLDADIEEYEESITDYEDNISDYQDEISDLNEQIADLTTTASTSGTITDVSVDVGDTVKENDVLATIVDNSKMKVEQYFSYAYEDDIYIGQTATVSVPSLMTTLTGTVTDIEYVNRLTTEGTQCFSVTITVENPGALTEDMSVGAYLNTSGGYIYPSVEGTLEYNSSKEVLAGGDGELTVCNVIDYQTVTAGQTLFKISPDTYQDEIDSYEKQITRAEESIATLEEKITTAQEKYSNYEVYSDIAGRVIQVNITAGEDGEEGNTAIVVYNMDTMYVEIDIDELDISYISTGMEVDFVKEGAESNTEYTGTVTEVSLEASTTNGVSTYPVTVEIDSEGDLSPGVSLTYSVSTGDTDETVLCPVAAVQYLDEGTYVYVQADTAPDNAVDLSSAEDADIPDGFYAVEVETGTTNATYIRILSGLEEGMTVFTGYVTTDPGGGETTSSGATTSTSTDSMQGNWGGGQGGGGMPSGGGGMPGG
ncbi:MAG: hypothetical protein H6Q60_161 [Oscillospiraceae bacterium]|nr:hypothetical protein [Oscillospiraceae bacterium]